MRLITLFKKYGFETETEFFNYLIESYINGSIRQCKELFNKLTKDQKKQALNYINEFYGHIEIYNFYFNLL